MKFKESFRELKKPVIWLHYVLGTLLFYVISKIIVHGKFISSAGTTGTITFIPFYQINLFSTVWLSLLIFLVVYILVDRTSHAVLGFN